MRQSVGLNANGKLIVRVATFSLSIMFLEFQKSWKQLEKVEKSAKEFLKALWNENLMMHFVVPTMKVVENCLYNAFYIFNM